MRFPIILAFEHVQCLITVQFPPHVRFLAQCGMRMHAVKNSKRRPHLSTFCMIQEPTRRGLTSSRQIGPYGYETLVQ